MNKWMEERIKGILETSTIYTVMDSYGRIEYANTRFCELLGSDLGELVGKPNHFLKSEPQDSIKYLKLWQTIKQGKEWKGILVGKSKNENTIWLRTKIVPIKTHNENSFKFLSVHEDITNIKSRVETIKNDTAMYHHIYESVKIGIVIVTDHRGTIIKWNKGAERAFGYPPFDILGKPLSTLMVKRYKRATFTDFLGLVHRLKRLRNQEILELNCIDNNGKEFPVEFVLSNWTIKGEDFYGFKMLDISKRIAFENRLKQKTKELELFMYRSAHDLNAPFSSAQGLINLMKDEKTVEGMQVYIEMLERTIGHAKVLSKGLANASLLSSHAHDSKEIDFAKIIQGVLQLLKEEENFESIQFKIGIQDSISFVSCPDLISTVFQNLIQNAIKYVIKPNDGHTPMVKIEIRSEENELLVQVSDNGKGIKKENMDRVFELYYRAEVENTPGTRGLGLYIVKKIVEDLNGTIKVESKVNKGTSFTVRFPNKK
ncbi:PAS domain S-box protein [Allomuricauda sp. M10]|uniref:PAS domain-containing sensor histidine kinase n=1 Tax=Allomuricauda sp. M10 TaxID=2683292 RepID=UPI001D18B1D3|nr:PAS domain S-box protein [Muricauda sp. M10]